MSETRVSHVSLTVSTVNVYIATMKFISEYDLWDEVQEYLKDNHKSDMFVDYDIFCLFRQMLENDERFDPKHPVIKALLGHNDPFRDKYQSAS